MKNKKWEQYQDYMARLLRTEKNIDLNQRILIKTVTFQVTDACNLACSYCYQINKHTNRMSFETAKKFVDLLFSESEREGSYLYGTEGIVIEFIGGEPLLEIDLIEQICDYFMWKAITLKHKWATTSIFSMISNGVLYFEPKVQKFLQKCQGRISFGISLDGCKELHDSCRVFPDGKPTYDLAEAGCEHYKKNYDSKMLTKMTIAPANITYVFKAIKNLIENPKLKYKVIHCNCVYEKGWEQHHSTELYKQLKMIADYLLDNNLEEDIYISIFEKTFTPFNPIDDKNYCGSTGSMLACDPFGKIFPCIRFMDTSLGNSVEPWCLGDVDNGIGILPKHKDKINILDSITLTSQSTDECINCPIQGGCGWCTGYNYQETGTPNKRLTYTCEMHKARFLANVYYWQKAHKKHGEECDLKVDRIPKEWALNIIDQDEYNMLLELSK